MCVSRLLVVDYSQTRGSAVKEALKKTIPVLCIVDEI
jgi:ribosomal protein S2